MEWYDIYSAYIPYTNIGKCELFYAGLAINCAYPSMMKMIYHLCCYLLNPTVRNSCSFRLNVYLKLNKVKPWTTCNKMFTTWVNRKCQHLMPSHKYSYLITYLYLPTATIYQAKLENRLQMQWGFFLKMFFLLFHIVHKCVQAYLLWIVSFFIVYSTKLEWILIYDIRYHLPYQWTVVMIND